MRKAKELLMKEENIIYLYSPITVRNKNKIYYRFVEIFMANFMI